MPTGSWTISMDAISCGLIVLRVAPFARSVGTSSTTHSGSLFDMNEPTPRMRMERPPPEVSVTITPGKRSASNCAIDRPGARSISSDVRTEWGTADAGVTPSALPPRLEQAATPPKSKPRSRWAWAVDMEDLLQFMDQLGRLVLMMMTPLAPRRPYSAVSAGSLSTSIDSMSLRLTPVRYPLGPGSITTPSSTYNGVLPPLMDDPPRMRTANPPSDVRVTSTPGKRPISTCSTDWPGALARSSDVTTALGDAVGWLGGGAPVVDALRWWQAELTPTRTGSRARSENEVIGVLPGHATFQYTSWRGAQLTLDG